MCARRFALCANALGLKMGHRFQTWAALPDMEHPEGGATSWECFDIVAGISEYSDSMRLALLSLLAVVSLPVSSPAQVPVFKITPATSKVTFKVKASVAIEVRSTSGMQL